MNPGPIGIFDSGVGGLTIWGAIHRRLPNERLIYLADSAHAPYGERTPEEITALSFKNVEYLKSKGAKAIVVACNTATTNAITALRKAYPELPFIGIEPATKPAALRSATGQVGILATKGTFASDLFMNTSSPFRGSHNFVEVAGVGLVSAIESGDLESARPLLKSYLQPMLSAGVDMIVLGCTHYPFLIPMMREMIPENIEILEPSQAIARQLDHVLELHDLRATHNNSHHEFLTTGNLSTLDRFMQVVGAKGSSSHIEIS